MADISVKELSAELKAAIGELKSSGETKKVGVVTRVGDGIAWIFGLNEASYNEMLTIETSIGEVTAFALNLMEDEIGAVLLGNENDVKAGDRVSLSGKLLEVPVGPELVGRVVDPLGNPLDDAGPIKAKESGLVERQAPGVLARKSVHEPLMTGVAAIDTMVPIGRGQRELIIGDRQTGKTAIAIDTMINQAKQKTGVINIYVAVGQKNAKIARLVERLKREGVMDQTIVVATSASDSASMQYLAPYAGAAMGEYFRDNGQHGLIIYDDLSKHAVAYRQMSLLLRRPPGREAYPGDVFFLHSRLLERAAKLSDDLGGGSLTALPIIETQAGDVSAFIPTNVISITDGQIFLESDLFNQGIRPAINVGLSVSRVGGSAQTKTVKSVSGSLRLDLAQFRELAAFAQFGCDLDADTKARIDRGQRLTELLKQPQYSPYAIWEQAALIHAGVSGGFDAVPVENIREAQTKLLNALHSEHKKEMNELNKGGEKVEGKVAELIEKAAAKVAKDYKTEE